MKRAMLFPWQKQIISSNLAPTTRHVLLTLSCHMNGAGESCFPSTKTLSEETGLSERSVITHLQLAREKGWVEVKGRWAPGQRWKAHQYYPTVPDEGTEPDTEKALNLFPEGTEPHDKKALKEVQCRYPERYPDNNTPLPPKGDDSFNGDVHFLFEHWKKMTGHPRAKLDKSRRSKILARLKEGYTVDDMRDAINGISLSAWHMGDNPEKKRYDDITLVFRTGSKLESFRDEYQKFIDED